MTRFTDGFARLFSRQCNPWSKPCGTGRDPDRTLRLHRPEIAPETHVAANRQKTFLNRKTCHLIERIMVFTDMCCPVLFAFRIVSAACLKEVS